MTADRSSVAPPVGQTWAYPPDGTYLPKIALVNWSRAYNPTLTISASGAMLEGLCREPLGREDAHGYECVAECVGWRRPQDAAQSGSPAFF